MNESQLPQFRNGLQPIGTITGTPMASKKQSSGLMKVLMAHSKMNGPITKHGKGKRPTGKKKGIKADQDVHFGKTKGLF